MKISPKVSNRIYLDTNDQRILVIEFIEMPIATGTRDYWRLIDLDTATVYCTGDRLAELIADIQHTWDESQWNFVQDKDA